MVSGFSLMKSKQEDLCVGELSLQVEFLWICINSLPLCLENLFCITRQLLSCIVKFLFLVNDANIYDKWQKVFQTPLNVEELSTSIRRSEKY
ncbi:CLUMA_CG003506, isoform A [Clunio marinus]|uniref:CLUMA_CG003506, isoform A n=1 Tax=Clunio marinus TaxID=568069 RepID=A0A1J1HNL6_9DIPT|nr:CLUMA_CG003506, isoform A [Clunio marinus]